MGSKQAPGLLVDFGRLSVLARFSAIKAIAATEAVCGYECEYFYDGADEILQILFCQRRAAFPGKASEEFYVVLCAKGLEKAWRSEMFPTKEEAEEVCEDLNMNGGELGPSKRTPIGSSWHVRKYVAHAVPRRGQRR